MAAIAGLRAGRVRLAAFPSAGATLMAAALARLRAATPGSRSSSAKPSHEDAFPLLRAGELDLVLGFSYAGGPATAATSTAVPLLHDPRTWSCCRRPPCGRGADRARRARRGDLDRRLRALPPALLAHRRARRLRARIEFETDDYVTVQSLIAAGLGVALLPALALLFGARRGHRRPAPLKGDPARSVDVVMTAAERRPPGSPRRDRGAAGGSRGPGAHGGGGRTRAAGARGGQPPSGVGQPDGWLAGQHPGIARRRAGRLSVLRDPTEVPCSPPTPTRSAPPPRPTTPRSCGSPFSATAPRSPARR